MRINLKGSITNVVLITVLGIIAYSNTFNSPFQFDDVSFIEENPIVRDLGYFMEPSRARGLELYNVLTNRYIGYLTFALNFRLHGFDVFGYHIINVTIHLINALLVYSLILLTFRTPLLNSSLQEGQSGHIAMYAGLLFVLHPVQTEAVTYIFQRLASLATLFYLLSLLTYARWRLLTVQKAGGAEVQGQDRITDTNLLLSYGASLLSAVFAMKTKENTFTLPFVVTLYEFLFFTGRLKSRALCLSPMLLTLFIIPLSIIGFDKSAGETIAGVATASRGYEGISRESYLLTQARVVVTYIRLLFFPVNQNIDYDYPVFNSFFEPQVFFSFLFIFIVLSFGIYLVYASRTKHPVLKLTAFGIFWFFITLSVESGIIPIPMIINEYRVYLPSIGVLLAITPAGFILLDKVANRKTRLFAVSLVFLIPLLMLYTSRERNAVWGSTMSLWEDTVRKSPGKVRGHHSLSIIYSKMGWFEKAGLHSRIALSLDPRFVAYHYNMRGIFYADAGLLDKAIEHYRIAINISPDFIDAHYNLGLAYGLSGLLDEAIRHFDAAIRIKPDFAEAHNQLAIAYDIKGLKPEAEKHFRLSEQLKNRGR